MAFEQQRLSKTSCLAHLMETVRARQRVLDNLSCSSTICRQQPCVSDLKSSAVLASLLFVQLQYELTGEKEDFRGLSASQIPHTVYGIRSALFAVRGLFSFSRFGISKLGQASFYLERQMFGEFEFSCSSSMRSWRQVIKKLKLEQKGTRC